MCAALEGRGVLHDGDGPHLERLGRAARHVGVARGAEQEDGPREHAEVVDAVVSSVVVVVVLVAELEHEGPAADGIHERAPRRAVEAVELRARRLPVLERVLEPERERPVEHAARRIPRSHEVVQGVVLGSKGEQRRVVHDAVGRVGRAHVVVDARGRPALAGPVFEALDEREGHALLEEGHERRREEERIAVGPVVDAPGVDLDARGRVAGADVLRRIVDDDVAGRERRVLD
mmetsp:Transcript_35626/g.120702  ORF Transcript_35626/g.120702 Transcript_35626/m.120702 type:complete len:233 (+) Transcript_35626:834-1532(+)